MVTSGYVGLGGFIALLEMAAGMWAAAVGVRSYLARRLDRAEARPDRLEALTYLAALLTYVLLGLSLASWLVLYLMLDSFVPQWPGAMCIYGVTRIGEGSRGVYGLLPNLVLLLQVLKPALVFAAGAALVLYRFYQRLGTRTLLPRVSAILTVVAALASVDAASELTYLAIPKRESLPTSGCCSVSAVGRERDLPTGPDEQRRMRTAYYGCQLLMAALLAYGIKRADRPVSVLHMLPLVSLAAITLWVSMRFLIDVASPVLLHLPYHHCLYDLVPAVPESSVAIGLLFWGTFCVGWAGILGWQECSPESAALAAMESRRWQAYALVGYLGSMAMLTLDLWLA